MSVRAEALIPDPPGPGGWPWPLDGVQGWFEALWNNVWNAAWSTAHWVKNVVVGTIYRVKDIIFSGLWSVKDIVVGILYWVKDIIFSGLWSAKDLIVGAIHWVKRSRQGHHCWA